MQVHLKDKIIVVCDGGCGEYAEYELFNMSQLFVPKGWGDGIMGNQWIGFLCPMCDKRTREKYEQA